MRGSVWSDAVRVMLVAGVVTAWGAVPAAVAAEGGRITVVHGVRGLVADVWLDGKKVLPSFKPERATDPVGVSAGTHHVEVRGEGDPESAAPLVEGDVNVPAGGDLTVVAHLDAEGKPTVSVFREDGGRVPAGEARVLVRHAAAADRIRVALDGRTVSKGLAPGGQVKQDVRPGTHAVAVSAEADDKQLLAPRDVPLEEGIGTALYLIGSAEDQTLTWLASPVPTAAGQPTGIGTGNSGLRAERDPGLPWPALAIAIATTVAMLGLRRRECHR